MDARKQEKKWTRALPAQRDSVINPDLDDLTRESAQEWMNYYAHTAEDKGNRLPETSWQPLAPHLRNAAALALTPDFLALLNDAL